MEVWAWRPTAPPTRCRSSSPSSPTTSSAACGCTSRSSRARHLEAGLPESFNVLLKELQALCLNVELDVNAETGVVTNTVRDQMSAAE
jgi:hypothetical protein